MEAPLRLVHPYRAPFRRIRTGFHPNPHGLVRNSVYLEPVRLRHASAIQRLASHPEVAATTNIPEPYPSDGALSWIMTSMPRQMAGVEYAFAVLRREDDRLVGVTSLMNVGQGEAELGYWIGYPYWGNGYATAANNHILRFAFEAAGIDRIYARPLIRNDASCRVLEKLGFGLLEVRENIFPKWDATDQIGVFELFASTWRDRVDAETDRQRGGDPSPVESARDLPDSVRRRKARSLDARYRRA